MSDVQTAATTAAAPPLAAPRLGRWANANELPVIDFAPLAGNDTDSPNGRLVRGAAARLHR